MANIKGPDGQQLKVGILDADVYGPSIPHLMGLSGRPEAGQGEDATCAVTSFCKMSTE